jgi:ubiquitin C-terminal hydrolase
MTYPNNETLDTLYENMCKEHITNYEEYNVVCKRTVYKSVPKVLIPVFVGGGGVGLPSEFQGRDLVAIVYHFGNAMGGHYVVQVKRGKEWFIIDDDKVSPLEDQTVKAPASFAVYSAPL